VLGGNEQYIMGSTGNVLHVGQIERLRIDVSIDGHRKQLSELAAGYEGVWMVSIVFCPVRALSL
jgi:hypothetical protein